MTPDQLAKLTMAIAKAIRETANTLDENTLAYHDLNAVADEFECVGHDTEQAECACDELSLALTTEMPS